MKGDLLGEHWSQSGVTEWGAGSTLEQHMLGLVSHWLGVLGGPLGSNGTHRYERLLKTRTEEKKLCPLTYSSPEY